MVSGDSTPEVSIITDAAKKIYLGGFQAIDKVPRKKDFILNYFFSCLLYTWDCDTPMSARKSNILEHTQI